MSIVEPNVTVGDFTKVYKNVLTKSTVLWLDPPWGGPFVWRTPNLKLHRATIGPSGDVMINENQITAVISQLGSEELAEKLENILGTCWDRELEPFRIAMGDGSEELIDRISV